MESNEVESKKKAILDKIFIKEEDTLKNLEEIVSKSSKHFKINSESDRFIIFEAHIKDITSKILLFFVGLYLIKQRGSSDSDSINISDLSKKIGVEKTSLSKPLGILIGKGYIKKDSAGNYSVEHYKIKEILGGLEN